MAPYLRLLGLSTVQVQSCSGDGQHALTAWFINAEHIFPMISYLFAYILQVLNEWLDECVACGGDERKSYRMSLVDCQQCCECVAMLLIMIFLHKVCFPIFANFQKMAMTQRV